MNRISKAFLVMAVAVATIPIASLAASAPRSSRISDDGKSRPDFYRYQLQAYPADAITPAQSSGARAAWAVLGTDSLETWQLVAPDVNPVPGIVTYTGRATTVSGRVTALALSPGCGRKDAGDCKLWLGAAGGGVWRLENPVDDGPPEWKVASTGLTSNAIGSLAVDPAGRGRVLYAGTGEQNSSADSEAGVGLFKSSDGGDTWRLLPASVPFADGLSIAAITVDPRDSRHLWFGTMTALHGMAASANASVPPGTADLGLFESRDGGATFVRVLSSPIPGSRFVGGVMQVLQDPNDLDTIYVSIFGFGVFRSSPRLDGPGAWVPVFVTGAPNDGFNRTVFALADLGRKTRIYVGDSVDWTFESFVYRVDDALVPASRLFDGTSNVGWIPLSSTTPGTSGFGSYNFCQEQCWYDIFIGTPPGQPDVVWIGGSMGYDEIFTFAPPSNGRAVMRSTDAGASFTDMTNDGRSTPAGMHPDQHAIVFNPRNPGMAFIGSDGGLVRTDGAFVDRSSLCFSRFLSGPDLADCLLWLSSVPRRIDSLNDGLATLQFQSVSLNPLNPRGEWMGGTQDNGTWSFGTRGTPWFESVGGDGGQSGFDAATPTTRVHSYFSVSHDVNFRGSDPLGWNWVSDPLYMSGEASAFYDPVIADPVVGGSMFVGLQHVFRTQDSGGPRDYLEQHCNEYTGDFTVICGDWVPLGSDLTKGDFGSTRTGGYVIAVSRSAGDKGTLWAATTRGRVLVSRNADAPDPAAVAFQRLDFNPATPGRNVTGIAIDRLDGGHAWISYTGYGANTPYNVGHVFEFLVTKTGTTITDVSYNLADMPVTALVRDDRTGDLFAGTDFGVMRLASGSKTWKAANRGLPPASVYGLTISSEARVLYAATHGRSVWRLDL
jgi:hypothetical protein